MKSSFNLKWPNRYMKIAVEISKWSSCLSRNVGCVITAHNRIVATGYNGAPSGVKNCKELGYCLRANSEPGTNLDTCMATHAEQNALVQAARMGISVDGGDIYVTTKPCITCMKLIINAGIKNVYYLKDYPSALTDRLCKESGCKMIKLEDTYNE